MQTIIATTWPNELPTPRLYIRPCDANVDLYEFWRAQPMSTGAQSVVIDQGTDEQRIAARRHVMASLGRVIDGSEFRPRCMVLVNSTTT